MTDVCHLSSHLCALELTVFLEDLVKGKQSLVWLTERKTEKGVRSDKWQSSVGCCVKAEPSGGSGLRSFQVHAPLTIANWPLAMCTLEAVQSIVVSSEVAQSCPTLCDPMDCSLTKLLCPWDFPGNSAGVDCHFLLQGILLTQGSNPGLPHCTQTLYCLSHHRELYLTSSNNL